VSNRPAKPRKARRHFAGGLPAFKTERHQARHDHHHGVGRESDDHHRNARRHIAANQIARRD
jgi:hypothetical protein